MYNAEFKKMFLEQTDNAIYYERQFNNFEEDEERYQKDLYDFSADQIIASYKRIGTTSISFLFQVNNRNTKYVNYALNQNVVKDGQNHYAVITQETLVSCLDANGIQNSVISKEKLKNLVGQLQNPMDKFLFFACFDGIDGKDHMEIVEFDYNKIDLNNKVAELYNGRMIPVSDELIMYAKESSETYEYNAYMTNQNVAQRKQKLEGSGSWKVSARKNQTTINRYKSGQVYKTLAKCINWLDLPSGYITIYTLKMSGCIDYINTLAEKYGISGKDVLYTNTETMNLVQAKYSFITTQRSVFFKKYKEYLAGADVG